MGYFGEKNVAEIPDRLDLPAGDYPQVSIKNIREMKMKDGSKRIIVTFRDEDYESPTSGLSFDWWIQLPDAKDPRTFTWFKNNLRTLGVEEDFMDEISFASKDKQPSDDAKEIIGRTGKLSLTATTSKGKEYINMKYFKLDEIGGSSEEMDDPWAKQEEEPATAEKSDVDDFLNGL